MYPWSYNVGRHLGTYLFTSKYAYVDKYLNYTRRYFPSVSTIINLSRIPTARACAKILLQFFLCEPIILLLFRVKALAVYCHLLIRRLCNFFHRVVCTQIIVSIFWIFDGRIRTKIWCIIYILVPRENFLRCHLAIKTRKHCVLCIVRGTYIQSVYHT